MMDRKGIREIEKDILDWFTDNIFLHSDGVAFELVFIKYLDDGKTLKRDSGIIFWDRRSLRSALFRSKAVWLNREKRENVYFRIHKEEAVPRFIWLDDVEEERGTIRTSPNSCQAFVPLQAWGRIELEEYKRAKNALVRLWGADTGAKAHRQPMRFPHTLRWKHGGYRVHHLRKLEPVYLADLLKNADVPPSKEGGHSARRTPVKEGIDYSREDFVEVLKRLSKGESYVSIYNWLYNKVLKENAQGIRDKKDPQDYVERTIRKAQEIHETRKEKKDERESKASDVEEQDSGKSQVPLTDPGS